MPTHVYALDRPEIPRCAMPDRFRHEITYFMSFPDASSGITLGPGEYWIRAEDSRRWLDEGCFSLVSPLSSEKQTEIELSEEQEEWLEWMVAHGIERVRIGD